MQIETMSKNIVEMMNTLSLNQALAELLLNDVSNPYDIPLPSNYVDMLFYGDDNQKAKILPQPFDENATKATGSFIRLYYFDGEILDGIMTDSQIHVDIIIANELWFIHEGNRSLIRAYEMMGRIIDTIGRRSASPVRLDFKGFQHMVVNTKFSAIRLYADYVAFDG